MKKYLVIGNPIDHSLSPLIHNFWIKKYKVIESVYEKKNIEKNELRIIVDKLRNGEINGVNITVPYKKEIIPFLDAVKGDAELTQSVNTLCKDNNKVYGYNTDTKGFKNSLVNELIDYKDKNVFIIGAGGVSSSILEAFVNTANRIYITNRTKKKADELKKLGIDEIYCCSVNDSYVMNAWAKKMGISNVKVIPDGSGLFTKYMGMLISKDHDGFGQRSWRYMAVINDGIVEKWWQEPGINNSGSDDDPYIETTPENTLKYLSASK